VKLWTASPMRVPSVQDNWSNNFNPAKSSLNPYQSKAKYKNQIDPLVPRVSVLGALKFNIKDYSVIKRTKKRSLTKRIIISNLNQLSPLKQAKIFPSKDRLDPSSKN